MTDKSRREPRFNQLLRSGLESAREWMEYTYWILYHTVRIFRDERVQFQANALAYRSLISLVPMLAVFFSFFAWLQGYLGEENLEKSMMDFLSRYIMPEAEVGDMIISQILEFVDKAKAGTFVGFILFILSSIFLFSAIERSFNLIWKVEHYRTLTQRFIIFTAIIFLSPILIGLSVYISGRSQISALIGRFTASTITQDIPITGLGQVVDNVYTTAHVLVPYLLVLAILMILYMAVPNTRVERRAAFFGAALAALCWELSKWGFSYFAKAMFISRANIYEIFAGFFMFLILMYLIAVIVLFGAELSYVIQNYRHMVRVDPRSQRPVSDAYLACLALVHIARRYLKGEDLPGMGDLAARYAVSIPQMRAVINRMAEAKILVRIGAGAGDSREVYEPNRELEQITLAQVLEAAASDSFLKLDYTEGVAPENSRKNRKNHDPQEEKYRTRLDDLFIKAQGDIRGVFSQVSLKEFILSAEKTESQDL